MWASLLCNTVLKGSIYSVNNIIKNGLVPAKEPCGPYITTTVLPYLGLPLYCLTSMKCTYSQCYVYCLIGIICVPEPVKHLHTCVFVLSYFLLHSVLFHFRIWAYALLDQCLTDVHLHTAMHMDEVLRHWCPLTSDQGMFRPPPQLLVEIEKEYFHNYLSVKHNFQFSFHTLILIHLFSLRFPYKT